MPVPIKVDEDLPEEVASVFATAGYETVTVHAQGWSGVVDEDLWIRIARRRSPGELAGRVGRLLCRPGAEELRNKLFYV